MGWVTFWADFSQTHPVALVLTTAAVELCTNAPICCQRHRTQTRPSSKKSAAKNIAKKCQHLFILKISHLRKN
jgi:hypothetical protein